MEVKHLTFTVFLFQIKNIDDSCCTIQIFVQAQVFLNRLLTQDYHVIT